MRIYDGYKVQCLPSFQALVKRLGYAPKESLRLEVDQVLADGATLSFSGYDVYRWQEFRDFCADLEVPLELLTKTIEFCVKEGESPTIIHAYVPGRGDVSKLKEGQALAGA